MTGPNGEAFLRSLMRNGVTQESCFALADEIDALLVGHELGEVMLALCFQLSEMRQRIPENARPGFLAAVLRLIDPPGGNA